MEVSKSYKDAIDRINRKVIAECRKEGHEKINVIYSAYEFDEYDIPIDNLDDIPIEGEIKLVDEGNFWDGFLDGELGKNYKPFEKTMISPTWLEIAVAANEMINCTSDKHHIYLEDVRFNDDGNVSIVMGS